MNRHSLRLFPSRAWMLFRSIALGWLLVQPAGGQAVDQDGNPPGVDMDRDAADAAWSQRVILASGDRFVGTLSAWNSDGALIFDLADTSSSGETTEPSEVRGQRIVAVSDLLRYGATPRPESPSSVVFVDGSELCGRIVELNADTCRLVSRRFDVSVPLESVRSMLFHAPVEDQIRQHQLQAAQQASGADDLILLMDGERREGTLRLPKTSIAAERTKAVVELKTKGGELVSIPLRRIRSIIPSPILREDFDRQGNAGTGRGGAGTAPLPRMRVGLVDGSVLSVGQWTPTAAARSSIVLECGVELTRRRTSQQSDLMEIIAMLTPTPLPPTGLTSEPPLRYRHLPFFGESYPLVRWSVAQDGPVLDGSWYPNGLLMRTAARAVYPTKKATRLTGAVAAADPRWNTVTDIQVQTNLGVRFRVQTSDSQGEVNQVWDSGVVRPGQPPIPFDLDVSGTALIILATDPVDSGDFGDRAVWLDLVVAGGDRR